MWVIKIDENFIKQRIAKLRTDKNISARELSLRLGQSTGYINSIENGKSLPSMSMFLYICEYFKITPKKFFDEYNEYPRLIQDIINESKKLNKQSLESLLTIIKNMNT
jgi:transcriptional regulator with XRE-family HTH domain